MKWRVLIESPRVARRPVYRGRSKPDARRAFEKARANRRDDVSVQLWCDGVCIDEVKAGDGLR